MSEAIRILILEDVAVDFELLVREIKREGLDFTAKHAIDESAFLQLLKEFSPEVILSDYTLPGYDAMEALRLVRDEDPLLPFIIVTGSINEETAVDCMKKGATDYILKDKLTRLVPAIKNAMERRRMVEERIKMEESIKDSEDRFRGLYDNMGNGVTIYEARDEGQDFIIKDMNKSGERINQKDKKSIIGKSITAVFPDASGIELYNVLHTVWKTGEPEVLPEVYQIESNRSLWITNYIYKLPSGEVVAVYEDITERKMAQDRVKLLLDQQLRVNKLALELGEIANLEELFYSIYYQISSLMDVSAFIISFYDKDEQLIRAGYVIVNRDVFEVEKLPPIPLKISNGGQSRVILSGEPLYLPDYCAAMKSIKKEYSVNNWEDLIEGIPANSTEEKPTQSALFVPMKVEGQTIGVMQIQSSKLNPYSQVDIDLLIAMVNVSSVAIRNARLIHDLQMSEANYRNVIEQSKDAIYILYENRFDLVNHSFLNLFGYSCTEVCSPEFSFLNLVAPSSKDLILRRNEMRMKGELPPACYEFLALTKSGQEIEVEASMTEISYRGGTAVQGIIRDISERKRLEEQLRQSQKMEGIGRLAGGVAHDFNNILTVVAGHVDMALMSLDPRDPLQEDIQAIKKATDKATALTRQLLAFSRRQTLQPKVIELNRIITNLDKMLRRIIGEDIDMIFKPSNNLWRVEADPGQLEQIIINLVVNARDAMPKGGSLTIETENVHLSEEYTRQRTDVKPGPYVLMAISDTGCGMSADVLSHIFEPFYTTKETGKGTGLGLSTVYGIVKQSGGHVACYSEEGHGTSFKIYLPQVVKEAVTLMEKDDFITAPSGNETILVVEDEVGVRNLACRVLKKQGYNVLEAESGGDAYLLCKQLPKPIDLMITDVVMPRMSGADLAKQLGEFWKDLSVLFMSGYTPDAIVHSGILDSDIPYIQKPFRPIDLACKVREVLDNTKKKSRPTRISE